MKNLLPTLSSLSVLCGHLVAADHHPQLPVSFVDAPPKTGARFAFFAGAGVRAGFDLPLGASLSARVSGDLVGHFTPYGLAVNGATVFSSSSFSGAVGLGLVRFF